ncbi:MAG: cysteine desulfurase [Ignavibacteria bacterium]|nr:cysteine desulfurase [Ignavibacteria bacterium]MCU7513184.1 cysteine desulfurase [Ignavibacteria bacterium]MCU7524886.1 cysteine desulfurase [Ignavibacteria bacterium]
MVKKVYFDNAATTPIDPRVLDRMLPYLSEHFGNPSSIHEEGRKVRVAIEEARETVAGFINAEASEIYFVSGGTEANNFPLFGISKTELGETGKKHIVSTKAEHHCVLESLEELSRQGFDTSLVNVKADSSVITEEVKELLSSDRTSLLSVIHVNNETGTFNDIKALSALAHSSNAYFHSDTVQSFGKVPIDVKALGVDSISFSSHKINGPKGSGAVYVKSGTPLSPLIFGGSQERNRRGGTENPASIIGFAEAVKIASQNMQKNFDHVSLLRSLFTEGVHSIDPEGIEVNGGNNVLPHVLSITFRSEYYNSDAEAMLIYLDINGVAASNGAACTSGTLKPSHVILSMGKKMEDARGTLRFSFGSQNTAEEVEYVLEILSKMALKFRKNA